MRRFLLLSCPLALIACSPERPGRDAVPAPPPEASEIAAPGDFRDADYVGRWVAADHATLTVAEAPGGGMSLTFQTAGGARRTLPGSVTAEGLRFMRDGTAETAILVPDPADPANRRLNVSDAEVYRRAD